MNIRRICLLMLAALAAFAGRAQEYPVTDFTSYTTRADALSGDDSRSPYYRALDGAGEFNIPFAWADKQIFLRVERAEGAVALAVNGRSAGRAEATGQPAAFDITALVDEGANTLTLAGGGVDGLYLAALPKVRVRDFEVRTALTGGYRNGVLDFGVVVKSHFLNEKSATVHFELFSPGGELLESDSRQVTLRMRGEELVHFEAMIPDVRVWNTETPTLYTVMTRVQYEGRYVEYIRSEVGFRSVEITGGRLLLGGQPAVLNGVTIHDFPTDSAGMAAALTELKQRSVNTIHPVVPQPRAFYEACDRLGFWVLPEAWMGPLGARGNDLSALESILDRVRINYERTKNYASVIGFSLGGPEAVNGYDFYRAYRWTKEREAVRPVVFAGAGREWNTDAVLVEVFNQAVYDSEQRQPAPRPFWIVTPERFDTRIPR